MIEFAYNKAKNASTDYIPFEFNYKYHPQVLFEEDIDSCTRSCSANKLVEELKKRIEICC